MNRHAVVYGIVSVSLLAVAGLVGIFVIGPSGAVDLASAVAVARPPRIRPDYSGTVIPPNIAPLNFLVDEPGTGYRVRIRAAQGEMIDVASRSGSIVIPLTRWQRLLSDNRGRTLTFEVCVRRPDGQWTRFEPIVNTIADADIDRYLFYRLIKPIYIVRVNVAIYQRDVQTYEESVVVSNQSFGRGGGCVNCHTFAPNHPDQMILHSRGSGDISDRSGMVVVRQGRVIKVDSRTLVRDGRVRSRTRHEIAGRLYCVASQWASRRVRRRRHDSVFPRGRRESGCFQPRVGSGPVPRRLEHRDHHAADLSTGPRGDVSHLVAGRPAPVFLQHRPVAPGTSPGSPL